MDDDIFHVADKFSDLYRGWGGKGFHPDSASGGGGPGFFAQAGQLGLTAKQADSLPAPDSLAGLELTANQIKEKFKLPDRIRLTELPDVMRKKNWPMGAAVMEKWFAGDVQRMTLKEKAGDIKPNLYPGKYTDTTMFSWKWLMQFKVTQDGKSNLINKLNNPPAISQLTKLIMEQINPTQQTRVVLLGSISVQNFEMVKAKNVLNKDMGKFSIPGVLNDDLLRAVIAKNVGGKPDVSIDYKPLLDFLKPMSISDFVKRTAIKKIDGGVNYKSITGSFTLKVDPVELHSYWQFQYEKVENSMVNGIFFGLDDLDAALHSFGLYAAVVEATITDNGKDKPFSVVIAKVGLYMKDTYEFLDDKPAKSQYLGHWSKNGVTYNPSLKGTWYMQWNGVIAWPVHNSDFVNYQIKNGKGGDLLLFSDVEVVATAMKFDLQFSS